jgi:hypothetical protein
MADLEKQVGGIFKGLLAAASVVTFIQLLQGVAIFGSVTYLGVSLGGRALAAVLILALLALAVFVDRGWNPDLRKAVPVAVSLVVVVSVIAAFLPDAATAPFTAILADLGVPVVPDAGDDLLRPVPLAAFATVFIVAWYAISRKLQKPSRKPETVAKRTRTDIQNLLKSYTIITRVVLSIGLALIAFMVAQVGVLGVELAEFGFADPTVFAHGLTILTSFLALGGEVPVLGTLPFMDDVGAIGILAIGTFLLFIGYGAREVRDDYESTIENVRESRSSFREEANRLRERFVERDD